jgi:hypothetical protein
LETFVLDEFNARPLAVSMNRKTIIAAIIAMTTLAISPHRAGAASFGDDVAFLSRYTDVIVLGGSGAAKVALAPAWQGRVMTSTAGGDAGRSFGWINRDFITAGQLVPHMNPFGGEDRFWLGPEGGQFSIFFAPGAAFEFANWFTPAPVDTLPFKVVSHSQNHAAFSAQFELTNYSGTKFQVAVNREVTLLGSKSAWELLGAPTASGVAVVAYETDNKISNAGHTAWKKDTGLLSIWILGMYNPSASTTIVVPIKPGPESGLGVKVTSDYFGNVPPDRLVVKDEVIYFSGDGKYRSKIGINPRRSKSLLGSYDAENHVLTVVRFSQPSDVTDYVNSLWKLQDHPFAGDVANSYNDGPATPGAKPMGPFYEIESSSPAAALAPGRSLSHVHRTFHLTGPEPALDKIAREVFGVSLDEIKAGLKP